MRRHVQYQYRLHRMTNRLFQRLWSLWIASDGRGSMTPVPAAAMVAVSCGNDYNDYTVTSVIHESAHDPSFGISACSNKQRHKHGSVAKTRNLAVLRHEGPLYSLYSSNVKHDACMVLKCMYSTVYSKSYRITCIYYSSTVLQSLSQQKQNKFWTPLPPSATETGRMGLLGMKYKSHYRLQLLMR